MEQSDLERELEQEIYGNRLLVLLEGEEGFKQVILGPEHFKKVSDAVVDGKVVIPAIVDQLETVMITTGEEILPVELFEGMRDFYEENELEAD